VALNIRQDQNLLTVLTKTILTHFLKKWWGILDLNQGPRHSGLCRLHGSPDYLFTHLKGVGYFFAVIKGVYTPSASLCTFPRCTGGLAQDCPLPGFPDFIPFHPLAFAGGAQLTL
jgi:hypothetical protein